MAVKKVQRFDSNEPPRVQRFDFSPLSTKPTKTPQGFLKVQGRLTRIGVLEYKRVDGSTFKELRLPDEVFAAASLDTLKGAPITDLHSLMVNPDNVKDLAVGHVGEDVRKDANFVSGTLTIQDAEAIKKVEQGDRRELSPGYTCELDATPGEYKGERYDGIQRNIIYNHLALLPKDAGRSGPEVALRMDGIEDGAAVQVGESEDPPKQHKKEVLAMKKKVTLDGVTYEIEIPEALAENFESAVAKLQKERKDAVDRVSTLEGEKTATEKEVKDLKEKLDSASAPEAVEKAVNERVALVERVKKLSPEIKTDGKSAKDLKIEALTAKGYEKETFDGKDDAFIDGVFEATVRQAEDEPRKDDGQRSVGAHVHKDGRDSDKDKEPDAEKSRMDMIERNRKMYEKPLSAHKAEA